MVRDGDQVQHARSVMVPAVLADQATLELEEVENPGVPKKRVTGKQPLDGPPMSILEPPKPKEPVRDVWQEAEEENERYGAAHSGGPSSSSTGDRGGLRLRALHWGEHLGQAEVEPALFARRAGGSLFGLVHLQQVRGSRLHRLLPGRDPHLHCRQVRGSWLRRLLPGHDPLHHPRDHLHQGQGLHRLLAGACRQVVDYKRLQSGNYVDMQLWQIGCEGNIGAGRKS